MYEALVAFIIVFAGLTIAQQFVERDKDDECCASIRTRLFAWTGHWLLHGHSVDGVYQV